MTQAQILCVDDEPDLLDTLRRLLGRHGHRVTVAGSGEEALVALDRNQPDLVITDLMMPDIDGMQVLERSIELYPDVPVLLITAYATVQTAVDAIRRGAYDYVPKPFTHQQLMVVVARALSQARLKDENRRLMEQLTGEHDNLGIVGESNSMRRIVEMIRRVAPTDLGVLITGESGTGKEVVARALHRASARSDRSFVPVDCGAIPSNLMESELFGHEKGAFTGASSARAGLVHEADGGTFFLDEVGELDAGVQVKLLRLLQEREYRRVGGNKLLSSDLRVVAATNRDLEQAVREGRFREDLFHRLNVVRVVLPPLRDRPADIPVLLDHFVARERHRAGRGELRFSSEVRDLLMAYSWPGNVRELLNCCKYVVGLAEGPVVGIDDLPHFVRSAMPEAPPRPSASGEVGGASIAGPGVRVDLPYKAAKRAWLEHFETEYIVQLLDAHDGNISQAARTAGIDRKSIQRLMKRNDLSLDELTSDER
jgi:DNA-binding NtrC family response regulator